jgi:hypothetical protein
MSAIGISETLVDREKLEEDEYGGQLSEYFF